jgi:hypothetical protein
MDATHTTDLDAVRPPTDEECLALLRGEHIGRLVAVEDAVPNVLAVRYVVDGHSIVCLVDSAQARRIDGGLVSLKVCHHDHGGRPEWTVWVRGFVDEDGPERTVLTDPRSHVARRVRIEPTSLTGRLMGRSPRVIDVRERREAGAR